MDELRRLLLYQHRLDSLKIVRQVGAVHIRLVLELDNRAHLFVLRRIHHFERLGYVSLLHPVDLLGYLGRQILVLELRCACVRVGHQSRVHGGVLVLRIQDDRLLKRQTVCTYGLGYTVQPMDSIDLVGSRHARLEQYMPAVDSLAVLLYQLDDMVAVLRLHNAAHFLRVVQAERHIRKLRHQLSATYKPQLTAVLRALGVLRVEPRQHREVG